MLLQKGVGHRGYWLATFAISAGGGQWWAGIPSKATVSTLDVTSSSKNSRPAGEQQHADAPPLQQLLRLHSWEAQLVPVWRGDGDGGGVGGDRVGDRVGGGCVLDIVRDYGATPHTVGQLD